MKVLPTNNVNNNRQTSFKSCLRMYNPKSVAPFDFFDKKTIRTSTNFFREDLHWNFFLKYMLFNFLNFEKVNTYSLAASDGSEAYSLAILLMQKLPEKLYNKFFPIHACDIDSEIIDIANRHRINIHDFEFCRAKRYYHADLHDYFINRDNYIAINNDDVGWIKKGTLYSYEPIDELKQAVQFKNSDILTELEKVNDKGNSIVLCRNVFPYLDKDYQNKIFKTLNEKLKTGSLFVAGEYDAKANIAEKLQANGFFRPVLEYYNIFQKQ